MIRRSSLSPEETTHRRRNEFRNMEPSSEGHSRAFFKRAGRWLAKAVLGLALATSTPIMIGAIATGCSSQQQDSNQKTKNGGQTDNNGNVTFNAGGWTFNIHVYDSITLQPISDLVVILLTNGGEGDYIILDPSQKYPPVIGGATGIQNNQISGSLTQAVATGPDDTNVLLPPPVPICTASANAFINSDLLYEIFTNPTNEPIKEILFEKDKSAVTLADLGNVMKQTSDLVKGEIGGEAASKGIVYEIGKFGASKSGQAAVSNALGAGDFGLPLTLCAAEQSEAFAAYYRSLGYSENTTFTVYRLNGIAQLSDWLNDPNIPFTGIPFPDGKLLTLLFGFNSPLFVVVPDSTDTTPAYSVFSAKTFLLTEDKMTPWKSAYDESISNSYQITQVGGALPPLFAQGWVADSDSLKIMLNASNNSTYQITAPLSPRYVVPDASLTYEQATTDPVKAVANDDYALTFYLQKAGNFGSSCLNGYQTYYKPDSGMMNDRGGMHHDIAVACTAPDGYQIGTGAVLCRQVMEIDQLYQPHSFAFDGNYLASEHFVNNMHQIRYLKLATGEITDTPLNFQFFGGGSNMEDGKLILWGNKPGSSDTVYYLLDAIQKSLIQLPIKSSNRMTISQNQILEHAGDPPSFNLYDINGNLLENIPAPPGLSNGGGHVSSFSGKSIVVSSFGFSEDPMNLYELGSQKWQALQPPGYEAKINGNNISFWISFMNGKNFGIYNLITKQQTNLYVPGDNCPWCSYKYNGDNIVIMNYSMNPQTVKKINPTTGNVQTIFQLDPMKFSALLGFDMYGSQVAVVYNDLAPNVYYTVCNF